MMRSLSWPRAVRMTIGTGASARSRRQTSSPSMPGSIRSRTTRSAEGQRPVERRPAVVDRLDREPLVLEVAGHDLGHRGVVVHHEDVRGTVRHTAEGTAAPAHPLRTAKQPAPGEDPPACGSYTGAVDIIVLAKQPSPAGSRPACARRARRPRRPPWPRPHWPTRWPPPAPPGPTGWCSPSTAGRARGARRGGDRRPGHRALADRLATGLVPRRGPAVQIGMDTPRSAPATSRPTDADRPGRRRGARPATDGGWWGIGLRRPHPLVFAASRPAGRTPGARQAAGCRPRPADPAAGEPRDVDTWGDAGRSPPLRPPPASPAERLAQGLGDGA